MTFKQKLKLLRFDLHVLPVEGKDGIFGSHRHAELKRRRSGMTTNFLKIFPEFLEKKRSFQDVREAWNGLMEGAYVCFMGPEAEWLTTSAMTSDLDLTIQKFKEREGSGDRVSVLNVTLIDVQRSIFEIHYRCGFWLDEAFVPSADEIRKKIAEAIGANLSRQTMEAMTPSA